MPRDLVVKKKASRLKGRPCKFRRLNMFTPRREKMFNLLLILRTGLGLAPLLSFFFKPLTDCTALNSLWQSKC